MQLYLIVSRLPILGYVIGDVMIAPLSTARSLCASVSSAWFCDALFMSWADSSSSSSSSSDLKIDGHWQRRCHVVHSGTCRSTTLIGRRRQRWPITDSRCWAWLWRHHWRCVGPASSWRRLLQSRDDQ